MKCHNKNCIIKNKIQIFNKTNISIKKMRPK